MIASIINLDPIPMCEFHIKLLLLHMTSGAHELT
jgi:hypothetical protein